jgi:3-oxoacyl-[acyl-carrier-protein] synthase III
MNGIVKQEALRPGQPTDYQDAWEILNKYSYEYNHQRLHAGINFLRPADVFFGRRNLVLNERREKIEMAVNAHARDLPGTWLAVASEALTKINDYTDISSHLFGDGAGAVVLRTQMVDDRGELLAGYSKSEPFNSQSRMIFRDSIANCIRMPDGSAVLKRAVDSMVESAVELKKECNWDRADIYIPHQANERIIAGVEKKLRDDGAIVYRNIAKYGNMSAATCVVALDEAVRDGTIKEGSRVILTSFGAGLVTSAVAIQF